MRLHALLNFFDEPLELLVAYVDGLAKAGVTSLVALDGRYQIYLSDEDVSPAEQRGIIDGACAHHGIGLTMSVPQSAWAGGEVEKRTALFALALAVSDRGDWWLNADADMIVTEVPDDLPAVLAAAGPGAATVKILDVVALHADRPDWNPVASMRCLFRARPLVVKGNHYTYWDPMTNEPVWSGTDPRGLEEPVELDDVVTIEHRPLHRSPTRVLLQNQMYSQRDATGLEMGLCAQCHTQQATARVAVNLRLKNGFPVGEVNELCGECGLKQNEQNKRRLLTWGIDPSEINFNERYSLPVAPKR